MPPTVDTASFGALVREHQSALRGFLRRLTRGDHALADDLAQETFLEAHRKLAQFRGDSAFAPWLYAIAWSRFLMTASRSCQKGPASRSWIWKRRLPACVRPNAPP